jgi:hypothetical protein
VRFNKRISIIGILMALIFGVVAIVPAMAATTGTLALDRTNVSPDNGVVTITLTDADLNTAVAVANETITVGDLTAGQSVTIFTDHNPLRSTPTIDNASGDPGTVDESSALVLEVGLSSSVQGRITITAGSAGYDSTGVADNLTIDYTYDDVTYATTDGTTGATSLVTVSSTVGGTISVELTETGAATGVFTGTFTVATDASALGGADNDSTDIITGRGLGQNGNITVTYADADPDVDVEATATVESIVPVITVVGPADDSRTQDITPTITVQITDASGIDEDSILFSVGVSAGTVTAGGSTAASLSSVDPDADDITAITNGFEVVLPLTAITDDATITVEWNVSGTDLAGNVHTFADDYIVVVDNVDPDMDDGTTGTWYDVSLVGSTTVVVGVVGDTAGDVEVNTSVAVEFDEKLDAATVAASDFEVAGVVPSAATVYTGAEEWVFLTVSALDTDDKPVVELVGSVSDVAGNTLAAGDAGDELTSADGLTPAITHAVSDTLVVGGETVTIDLSFNEGVSTPYVAFTESLASGDLDVAQTVTLVSLSANSYDVDWATDDDGSDDGAYVVFIRAIDEATPTNTACTGQDSDASLACSAGIQAFANGTIVFEVDSDVPTPTNNEPSAGFDEAAVVFLTLDFAGEATEYADDTHDEVVISAADLGGDDVLSDMSTEDNVLYEFSFPALATGDFTLTVTATDEAGNAEDFEIDFTVIVRGDYTIALDAGWNLISVPADPADTSIDSVFPSTHPASQILTYDLSDANGPWLAAVRADNGTWTGTLTTIDSSHGYWVNTDSSRDADVLLEVPSQGAALLPTIAVNAGWNLVPVVDLEQAAAGVDVDADEYFATISWVLAYTFTDGAWVRVSAENNAAIVDVGSGYWVWTTKAGTLVP